MYITTIASWAIICDHTVGIKDNNTYAVTPVPVGRRDDAKEKTEVLQVAFDSRRRFVRKL